MKNKPSGSPRCITRPRSSKFVDIFRTTPVETVCPNFYVLAHATKCRFDPACSYCYLKSSFGGRKTPEVFVNTDRMMEEVEAWIASDGLESYVLNTGNLSDSLIFEDVRPVMPELIDLFRRKAAGRPHTLLIVTKGGTKECAFMIKAKPCANVTISFSVNAPEAAAKFEAGAPPSEDRLKAARQLKKRGWRVRMRIDPMILGYDYAWLIEQVYALAPERLTIGTLRAERNLPRFAEDGLFDALEPIQDNKKLARYPLDQRLAMYRQVVDRMKKICPIGLCEETPNVWNALGLDTESKSCNCGG